MCVERIETGLTLKVYRILVSFACFAWVDSDKTGMALHTV